jgi:hypothetical protein
VSGRQQDGDDSDRVLMGIEGRACDIKFARSKIRIAAKLQLHA